MQIQGFDGAIGDARWWARAFCFSALLGAVVALLGPFGSFYNDVALRLIDWTTVFLLQAILLGLLIPLMMRLGTAAKLPRWFTLGGALAIVAIPGAVIAATVTNIFWGQHVSTYRWYDWYLQTLLLIAITTLLWGSLEIARAPRKGGLDVESSHHAPTGDVICLQMEDHYVRVHRMTGSTLELMALRDAIRRYGNPHGLQVHRGWWVAADAARGAERNARNWRLILRNGLEVPVARNRINLARERGWLDRG